MKLDHTLYGIIGPEHANGRDMIALVRAAAEGGMTLLQYRDKHSSTRIMVDNARALKHVLVGTGVPLLINDRVDVALAAHADGVHLGQTDMDPKDARKLLGDTAIIGWTLKTDIHALTLAGQPVDYATIGGVFTTTSKDNPDPPLGLDGLVRVLSAARRVGSCPIGAIAGIDQNNVSSVIAAGVDGVAVISALFNTEDPATAARDLRNKIANARGAR